jgi:hypothetical protein
MWCRLSAWRAAVGQQCVRPRSAHDTRRARRAGAARSAVFGARGQNLDCIDVVKATPDGSGANSLARRCTERGLTGVMIDLPTFACSISAGS